MKKFLFALLCCLPLTASAVEFDEDVPAAVKDQILGDLEFMKTLRADRVTPLHQQIFGAMNGAYGDFFTTRVKSVGLSDCGNPNAVACVQPFWDPSKMWLTQNYIRFSHPQVAKMMVVYHEARHTETRSGNWMHATCPRPFKDANGNEMKSIWTGAALAGQAACDSTPLGSYGSSTILLKNVQKFCSNCTEKVKMDSGIYADDQFGRITNANAKQQMITDFQTP